MYVWFGLVWFGLVWFGLVWYGMLRTYTHTEYAHRYGWAITITKELHMIDSNRSELYHLAPPRLSQEIAGGGLQYPWLSCTRPRPSYFVPGPRVEGRGPELGLKMIGNGGLTPQIWMNFMGKVLINHEILGHRFLRQTQMLLRQTQWQMTLEHNFGPSLILQHHHTIWCANHNLPGSCWYLKPTAPGLSCFCRACLQMPSWCRQRNDIQVPHSQLQKSIWNYCCHLLSRQCQLTIIICRCDSGRSADHVTFPLQFQFIPEICGFL